MTVSALLRNKTVQMAILAKFLLIFCFQNAVEFFQTRPEVNNPTTSLKYAKESVFLIRNGVNIYDGGALQPSPWLLILYSVLDGIFANFYAVRIFFIFLDLLIGVALYKLTSKFVKNSVISAENVAKCYLYSPMGLFGVMGMNLGLFTMLIQLGALFAALNGNALISAFLTGFLIHTDIYNLALIAPISLSFLSSKRVAMKCLTVWLLFTISGNFLIKSLWNVRTFHSSIFDSVHLSRMRIDSLRPNSGLSWYLFAQVFPIFTPLLKVTFQLTLIVFWPACAIKFRKNPLFMFFALFGSLMILKGYPSVSDYALFFGLLMTQAHLFEYARVLLIALFVAAGVYVLKMQIWRYWIELPGFNANFYYIFTLIWNAVLIIIYSDLISAYNKFQIYRNNPKLKGEEYAKCKLFQR